MIWSWNKLSPAKWEDAWSERIAGNPNASITIIKGGKTIRITVYCDHEEDALTLKEYFGGDRPGNQNPGLGGGAEPGRTRSA